MLITLLRNEITQEEYMSSNDVVVLYEVLPKKVYGFILRYKDRNIITINKNMSEYKKKQTILHEFAHLELNHLSKKKRLLEFKIEDLEDEADKYIKELEGKI